MLSYVMVEIAEQPLYRGTHWARLAAVSFDWNINKKLVKTAKADSKENRDFDPRGLRRLTQLRHFSASSTGKSGRYSTLASYLIHGKKICGNFAEPSGLRRGKKEN
ncbi:hypothetical protein RRG08_042372 [Elysia crispata]|uniref:Uncharacterized protein n=1 Tax=Elysia crispata TaxID=231223 RepID=A0AAE1DDM1_9GAST|nr:hypothetical protein RRG08_042372 [Elysia crispata]